MEKENIITGIRPTGNLTLANYAGAVRPFLDLQKTHENVYFFVADLHALTDYEPEVVAKYRFEVVKDYLALGIDPKRVTLYLQTATEPYVSSLTLRLSRLMTAAELMRVPTLKDKIKTGATVETANALLLLYPVLMAADIFLQEAKLVPVGEDQVAHLEVARELARDFNSLYGQTLVEPKPFAIKPLKILSLKGETKMSKSYPEGAIFLTDEPEVAAKKVMRAQTAEAGEMTPNILSLFSLAEVLNDDPDFVDKLNNLRQQHMSGETVMGNFKTLLAEEVKKFLTNFQKKRLEFSDDFVKELLEKGAIRANENAKRVVSAVQKAMGI